MSEFLGLQFIPIRLEQQDVLDAFLRRYPQRLSGYTFASLVSWAEVYRYEYVWLCPNTLLISFLLPNDQRRHLIQPEGDFPAECHGPLLQQLNSLPYPLAIHGVTDSFVQQHPIFCSHFSDMVDRGMANYIYSAADLATLAGRRYSKKRNLIAQARSLYQWEVESLTDICKPHCCQILDSIIRAEPGEPSPSLLDERMALQFMVEHFARLKQRGCLIRVEGKPVAFSLYEELNPKTAVIHFEKAFREYKGLYQIVNRESATRISQQGYEWINREEDLNIEGLRQTKLSYFPTDLVRYHILTYGRN